MNRTVLAITGVVLLAFVGCKKKPATDADGGGDNNTSKPTDDDGGPAVTKKPVPPLPPVPRGLPQPPALEATAELVARGAELFSDQNLWGGRSCEGCHDPERAFTSATALDITAAGKTNLRHTPTLTNLAFARAFYWDGRASTIESMLPGHARGQLGVGLPDADAAAALAAFVRTRYLGDSAWDRYEAGDATAVGEAAIRGAAVFTERAGCAVCHPPPLFTDLVRHPSAVPAGVGPPDRATRFKTPGLRGINSTSPYFHAGTAMTLDDALTTELTRDGVELSAEERADLVAFLETL